MVSNLLGSAAMPPTVGMGSGKETAASMSDVVSRLDRMEEVILALTAKVGDIDQQQAGTQHCAGPPGAGSGRPQRR
jgi:hypothetical protein